MGHLTLISEDVINALEHYPPDLRLSIAQYAPQPAWDDYVTGRYNETKKRDTSLLGGGKPVVAAGANRTGGRWKVDEEDSVTSAPIGSINNGTNGFSEIKSEFRRAGSSRPIRESTADFGAPGLPETDDEDEKASVGPSQVGDWMKLYSVAHYHFPVRQLSGSGDAIIKSIWIIARCIR